MESIECFLGPCPAAVLQRIPCQFGRHGCRWVILIWGVPRWGSSTVTFLEILLFAKLPSPNLRLKVISGNLRPHISKRFSQKNTLLSFYGVWYNINRPTRFMTAHYAVSDYVVINRTLPQSFAYMDQMKTRRQKQKEVMK